MKNPKWFYVHTINHVPAQFYDGEQICYANGTRGHQGVTRVCESLKELKEQQRLSKKYRLKRFGKKYVHEYGYFRISREFFNPL